MAIKLADGSLGHPLAQFLLLRSCFTTLALCAANTRHISL
jgi:hypothetical protein